MQDTMRKQIIEDIEERLKSGGLLDGMMRQFGIRDLLIDCHDALKKPVLNKIAMGCKPDPYKFKIIKTEIVNGNTIVLANFEGCLSFSGNKLMLLRGTPEISDVLDPHFLNETYPVIARFIPTDEGWNMAKLCAKNNNV